MNNFFKKGINTSVVLSCTFTIPLAFSAALNLPTTPLISGSAVEPNMMLLLDSSGSMNNIVPDAPYDADITYYDCPDEYAMTTWNTVIIKTTDSDVYFYDFMQGGYVQFGQATALSTSDASVSAEVGITRKGDNDKEKEITERCFDSTQNYSAALYAINGTGNERTSTDYYNASYSGNYLNWYFDTSTGGFSEGKKEGTYLRMEVAKDAAVDLVDGLTDIRVGLAQYNGKEGAEILVDIDGVDVVEKSKTQADLLQEEIADIDATGSTPLAESLQDLGWYFTEAYSGNLTLHEGLSNQKSYAASSIFDYSINHKSDVISADKQIVQQWCQQNFIVALTDGLPTSDEGISSKLQDYDKNQENGTNVVQAMFDTDLRPDLNEDDGTSVINNVITYIIGFADESATSSDLLSDMANAGGGGEFLTAANSADLVTAFKSASQSIFAKTAAMSAISLNTTELTANSALYQANFNTANWSGSLSAYELSDTGAAAEDATWDVADLLDALTEEASGESSIYARNIFTYNEDTNKGTQFVWNKLSDNQKNDLKSGPDADSDSNTADEDDAKSLLNYLYGDTANEGNGTTHYRTRSSRLGDIVNSTSVYVGTPELNWPDYSSDSKFGTSSKNYSAFKSANAARTPVVYVGANDGMLHGFNASLTGNSAGQEVVAYVPGMIASTSDKAGLHYLAEKEYAHRFYVDLTPSVSDVYINNAWRSVLVGGLRAGGQGLFALDITNPADFAASDAHAEQLVLWEFSSADDADFGYSYSEPTIAMMENGKWAVITGNGYNNSGTGTASLFILFIEEGADGTWSQEDYVKIDTQVGSTATPNGLATPTVIDSNGDSVADTIYAGDLQGNMWKFDVTDSSSAKWEIAKQGSSAAPLFSAKDANDNAQPITSRPLVTRDDENGSLLVFFGAGQYLQADDLSDTSVMSYYAVRDTGSVGKARKDLAVRTLLTNESGLRAMSGGDVDWDSVSGWYFDLINQKTATSTAVAEGERVISESVVSGDILFFNSIIPDSSACAYGGDSWFMSVDLATGLAPSYAIFDADGDGVIENTPASEGGDIGYIGEKYESGMLSNSTILDSTQYSVDSGGELVEREVEVGATGIAGRLSWSELMND